MSKDKKSDKYYELGGLLETGLGVAGSVIGGPIGGVVGKTVGNLVGGAIDKNIQKQEIFNQHYKNTTAQLRPYQLGGETTDEPQGISRDFLQTWDTLPDPMRKAMIEVAQYQTRVQDYDRDPRYNIARMLNAGSRHSGGVQEYVQDLLNSADSPPSGKSISDDDLASFTQNLFEPEQLATSTVTGTKTNYNTDPEYAQQVVDFEEKQKKQFQQYAYPKETLAKGTNLNRFALDYDYDIAQLMEMNNLTSPVLKKDTELILPPNEALEKHKSKVTTDSEQPEVSQAKPQPRELEAGAFNIFNLFKKEENPREELKREMIEVPQFKQYKVKKGQGLDAIAKANKITTKELLEANPGLKDPKIGQLVDIPEGVKSVEKNKENLLKANKYFEAYQEDNKGELNIMNKYEPEMREITEQLKSGKYYNFKETHDFYLGQLPKVMEGFVNNESIPFSLMMLQIQQEDGGDLSSSGAKLNNNPFNIKYKPGTHFMVDEGYATSGKSIHDRNEGRTEKYIAFKNYDAATFGINDFMSKKYGLSPKDIDYSKPSIEMTYTPKPVVPTKKGSEFIGKGISLPKDMTEQEVIDFINKDWKKGSDRENKYGSIPTNTTPSKIKNFIDKDIGKHFVDSNKESFKDGKLKKGKYYVKPYVIVAKDGTIQRLKSGESYSFSPHEWYAVKAKDGGYATDVAYAFNIQNNLYKNKNLQEIIDQERKIYAKENGIKYVPQSYAMDRPLSKLKTSGKATKEIKQEAPQIEQSFEELIRSNVIPDNLEEFKKGGYLKDKNTYVTKDGKETRRGLWANVYLKNKNKKEMGGPMLKDNLSDFMEYSGPGHEGGGIPTDGDGFVKDRNQADIEIEGDEPVVYFDGKKYAFSKRMTI